MTVYGVFARSPHKRLVAEGLCRYFVAAAEFARYLNSNPGLSGDYFVERLEVR